MTRFLQSASIVAVLCMSSEGVCLTRYVPNEYSTINAALTASASGDTVLVAPGTYCDYEIRLIGSSEVASCAFLKGGVTLISESGPGETTIDMHDAMAQWTRVVFFADSGEEATIAGFTITESQPVRGSVRVSNCTKLTLRDCHLRDMESSGSGGGITADYSDLEITGCRFTNCHADIGGAVWQFDGRIVLRDCGFEGCQDRAVALMGEQGINPEGAEIERCRFVGCHSELNGGAIFTANTQDLVSIVGCVFESNTAEMGGGAASLAGGPHWVEDCVFVGNWGLGSSARGGALMIRANTVVGSCTFFHNGQADSGPAGAAVAFYDGACELRNNIVAASLGGAAIWVRPGYATVTSSCNVFWENEGGIGDGYTPGPTDREVNPLFCDPENGDLSLAENSPCLPPQSGACGLIGALGRGCGPISVESRSWGRIKDLYR